jgi:hypothetical protein
MLGRRISNAPPSPIRKPLPAILMRHSNSIITLTIMFGLFGCKDNKKKDFVFDEFKSQIENIGMKIDSVNETGLICISQGELTLKISLDNVRRNYERDKELWFLTQLNFQKIGKTQNMTFTFHFFLTTTIFKSFYTLK